MKKYKEVLTPEHYGYYSKWYIETLLVSLGTERVFPFSLNNCCVKTIVVEVDNADDLVLYDLSIPTMFCEVYTNFKFNIQGFEFKEGNSPMEDVYYRAIRKGKCIPPTYFVGFTTTFSFFWEEHH